MALANVRLEYLGAVAILNEGNDTAPEEGSYYMVEMSRVLKSGNWNTFCVPFAMTAEQLEDNGIMEVRELSGVTMREVTAEDKRATLSFTKVGVVEAGKPYIVKANGTERLNVYGVKVLPASSLEDNKITFNAGVTM